jgi:hypothetical protein
MPRATLTMRDQFRVGRHLGQEAEQDSLSVRCRSVMRSALTTSRFGFFV